MLTVTLKLLVADSDAVLLILLLPVTDELEIPTMLAVGSFLLTIESPETVPPTILAVIDNTVTFVSVALITELPVMLEDNLAVDFALRTPEPITDALLNAFVFPHELFKRLTPNRLALVEITSVFVAVKVEFPTMLDSLCLEIVGTAETTPVPIKFATAALEIINEAETTPVPEIFENNGGSINSAADAAKVLVPTMLAKSPELGFPLRLLVAIMFVETCNKSISGSIAIDE